MKIYILSALLFLTVLGLSAEKCPDPACNDDHAEPVCTDDACTDDHDKDDDDDHDEDGGKAPQISPEALKNYGVTFQTLEKRDYTAFISIPAQVEKYPGAEMLFTMPVGGQIQKILVQPGEAVRTGQPLIRIIRSPIARPALLFTGSILQPDVKGLRETAAELAKAIQKFKSVEKEFKRLSDAQKETDAGMLIPRKDLIDAENNVIDASANVDALRRTLAAFGYGESDMGTLQSGAFIVPKSQNWIAALKRNNYWSGQADSLYALLPEKVRAQYWTVAGIGELEAMGLVSPELLEAAARSKALREGWTDAASLLIQGNGAEAVEQWADEGWLNAVVKLTIPQSRHSEGWDIESIAVKNGQQLQPGDPILTVVNHEQMVFSCRPLGSELRLLNQAIIDDLTLEAVPVIRGTGEPFKNLKISSFTAGSDNADNTALVPVENRLLKPHRANLSEPRVWQLREGMKYLLRIPERKPFQNIYVVPAAAVTDLGSDKIIILKHGGHLETAAVTVLMNDGDLSILEPSGKIKPGMTFAASGAFRLNLALQKDGSNATDPHAGCSH